MTSEESWAYTPREFLALAEVHARSLNGWRAPRKPSNKEAIDHAQKIARTLRGEPECEPPAWYVELQKNRAKERVN